MIASARWLVASALVVSPLACELLVGSETRPLASVGADAARDDASPSNGDGSPGDAANGGDAGPPPAFGEVVVLARGQSGPRGIAINATQVFWTNFDADTVGATTKDADGGVVGPLTGPDHAGCLDIVAYGDTIAWLNTRSGRLVIKPLAAAGTTVSNCAVGVRMSQDAVDLFYVERCSGNESNLWRVPKTGPKMLASQVPPPETYGAVASDGLSIFAAQSTAIVDVTKPADAGLFVATPGAALDVIADATAVYWLQADGTVNRRDKATGAATKQLATAQPGLARLALYKDQLFWTAGGASPGAGFVATAPVDGSRGPVVLASAQQEPFGVAADDTGVYWANAGDGTIAKVPRLP